MDKIAIDTMFMLISSAISGEPSGAAGELSAETFEKMLLLSKKHDVDQLVAEGAKRSGVSGELLKAADGRIFKAVYRYQQIKHEFARLCAALESGRISHLPLKGSVLRDFYPSPWMRTSCDIDVLVRRDELLAAEQLIVRELGYTAGERATHDVSYFSPTGVHVELHFDLVEEGRANSASEVLTEVWQDATLCEGSSYRYAMSDAFFYFYHIAHMAKHFENGGCGIRPFVDLWILDSLEGADATARDALLSRGGLLRFAEAARGLTGVWFKCREPDSVSARLSEFLLHGGAFGSSDNRVMLQQKRRGGRFGYIMSRIFLPYSKLKQYYPVLERHPYLLPIMEVRRWFMLLRPDVARMAKSELSATRNIGKGSANEVDALMDEIGL